MAYTKNPKSAYERTMARTHWEGDCLIFDGYKDKFGYGCVRDGNYIRKTHVVVYEHEVGTVPKGMVVDHAMCNRTSCVRSDHMEVITPSENSQRMNRRVHGPLPMTVCAICGRSFRTRWRSLEFPRQFCSRICMDVASGQRTLAMYQHTCEVCGDVFDSPKRQQRTCGWSCRGRLAASSKKILKLQ